MSFRVLGLDPNPFRPPSGRTDADPRRGVGAHSGVPDRVGRHVPEFGEPALPPGFEHLPADAPARSRQAIFVAGDAARAPDAPDVRPEAIRHRPIRPRAVDAAGSRRDAAPADGTTQVPLVGRLLAEPAMGRLHARFDRA